MWARGASRARRPHAARSVSHPCDSESPRCAQARQRRAIVVAAVRASADARHPDGPTRALLVAVALAVLVGSAVPLNVAGWGPREGVTAGIFALAGLGSATGLTVSVVFGVLAVKLLQVQAPLPARARRGAPSASQASSRTAT